MYIIKILVSVVLPTTSQPISAIGPATGTIIWLTKQLLAKVTDLLIKVAKGDRRPVGIQSRQTQRSLDVPLWGNGAALC